VGVHPSGEEHLGLCRLMLRCARNANDCQQACARNRPAGDRRPLQQQGRIPAASAGRPRPQPPRSKVARGQRRPTPTTTYGLNPPKYNFPLALKPPQCSVQRNNTYNKRNMEKARPLALWGLVSASVFTDRPAPDFYLGLIPFFEPYIEDNDGKVLDVGALKNYAETKLFFQLNDDITDLFIARMEQVGWLQIVADDGGARVYRCKFSGSSIEKTEYANADKRLTQIVEGFRRYLLDSSASLKPTSTEQIEEHFLRFLSRQPQFEREPDNLDSSNVETGQIEYWIAKYIGSLARRNPEAFEFVQQIAGISLLTDALAELRNPSESIAQAKTLLVFLDGPLLMNHLGLSGKRAKENTSYIIEKLRQAGATIACFRHSCDEVKDNLVAVLARPPYERTGPTAEAMRDGSVTETFLASIKNNVEHFVKTLGKVQILPQKVSQFKSMEKFCDDNLRLRLSTRMPAQSDVARSRDADSITIIMRRRQGFETSDLCASRVVLVTSNPQLVRRSNDTLREYKALGTDKSLIGPAIQDRIVAGILFANFGLTEKKDISRKQLLATCARVIMLRPKILDRMRQQIAALNRPEDAAIVDALLSQPRASEIVMDYTIGKSRSISASNIEDLISAIKKVSADEVRRDYEARIERERTEAEHHLEQKTRELISEISKEKENFSKERQERITERGSISEKIAALEDQLAKLNSDRAEREKKRRLDFDRMLASGKLAAESAMKKAARQERIILAVCLALLVGIFFAPLIFTSHLMIAIFGLIGAALSGLAMLFFLWNRSISHVNRFFENRAALAVQSELKRLQMDDLQSYMQLDYKNCRVNLLLSDQTKSIDSGSSLSVT
jgi:hypothetical protein